MANADARQLTAAPVDIAIIGGGMVGLSLACLIARANPKWQVVLLEQMQFAPAATPLTQPSFDARSTAIAEGSVALLRDLGIWPSLSQVATAIKTVHVSDRGHFLGANICAADQSLAAVGYVVPNAALGQALLAAAREYPNLSLMGGASVTAITPAPDTQEIMLAAPIHDQSVVRARLAVLADGGESGLRERLGIHTRRRDYQQRAIICNIRTAMPHQGVAYERFTDAGPLALLPLAGDAGRESALIWTLPHAEVEALLEAADAEFLQALQARFGYRLGRFEAVSARASFSLSLVEAEEQVRSRLVLLGNAAHYLHPVAGQGFNLSLRDCAALTQSLLSADARGVDIGSLAALAAYRELQASDQKLTIEFSHYLVKLFSSDYLGAIAARHLGLLSLELLPALKQQFAEQTMGVATAAYQVGTHAISSRSAVANPATTSSATTSPATTSPATTNSSTTHQLAAKTMSVAAEIVIIGAGLVGATLALAIAEAGARAGKSPRILLVEAAAPTAASGATDSAPQFDPRVVALNLRSQELLKRIGVWDGVQAERVSPYEHMFVWDGEGTAAIDFSAREARVDALGHIVENSLLVRHLQASFNRFSNIELIEDRLADFIPAKGQDSAQVVLSSGAIIAADLVLGADGARSKLRDLVGIETRAWDYGHTAIVTTIATERSHRRTAWQQFTHQGPLALLPLQHQGDERYCSIVWSLSTPVAEQKMALADADFCRELTLAMGQKVGGVTHCDQRFAIPLRQCHAKKYVLANVALLGDAAHAIHPLAGQGVNLGLADVAALVAEIERAWLRDLPLTDFSLLRRYQRARMGENLAMMAAMETFKQLFGHQSLSALLLRNVGMAQMQRAAQLKKWIIRHALGRV